MKRVLIFGDLDIFLRALVIVLYLKAEFAFLSAFQTTTGDESLSEGAVYTVEGRLVSGYRSVMATIRSIRDELTPTTTDEFYKHIMKDGERPDPNNVVEALHVAVQKLRQRPGAQLTDWIPFVHLCA
ncbi:hypothetical protein CPB86DRAFT_830251 [Serendipita vermifera]|nr:hypothetical protein CPB86DRAFT_830251 [Serendipita vermifera]